MKGWISVASEGFASDEDFDAWGRPRCELRRGAPCQVDLAMWISGQP